MKKKVLSLLCVFCLALTGIITVPENTKAAEKTVYVSLGDSIAAGATLDNPQDDSYSALLAGAMQAELRQEAVAGMTSASLLKQVTSDTKVMADLKEANVVTISIGSNDIMRPFLGYVAKALKCQPTDIESTLRKLIESKDLGAINEFVMALKISLAGDADSDAGVTAGIKAFSENFPKIVATIKEYAPNAEIYVTTVYNPLKGVKSEDIGLDAEQAAELFIPKMNQVIVATAQKLSCKTVDVYQGFKTTNEKVLNADMASYNMDPHPTAVGQSRIADYVYDAMLQGGSAYAKKLAAKGSVEQSQGLSYTVTASTAGERSVSVKKLISKSAKSAVIPETISLDGVSYRVVTIGAKAFYGKGNLKKITIKTNYLTGVGTNALKGINSKAVILVPGNKLSLYKKLLKNKGQGKKVVIKAI